MFRDFCSEISINSAISLWDSNRYKKKLVCFISQWLCMFFVSVKCIEIYTLYIQHDLALSWVFHVLVFGVAFYFFSNYQRRLFFLMKRGWEKRLGNTVQNFAACIIVGLRKYNHVSSALKELKWLNVKDQLYLRDAVLVFNSLHKFTPSLSENFIRNFEVHSRVTGNINDLHLATTLLPYGPYYRTTNV